MNGILDEEKLDLYRPLFSEYCQLATCSELSEAQADRMLEILDRAQEDSILDFLIAEADHIIAHEQGLMEEKNKQRVRQWQYFLDRTVFSDCPETMEVLIGQLQRLTGQLQSRWRAEGCHLGSEDGVLGQRTQEAVPAFETAKNSSDRFGDVTRQLQSRLREEGFDPGPVDGVLGQRTQEAVQAFKTAKGTGDRSGEVTQLCVVLGLS